MAAVVKTNNWNCTSNCNNYSCGKKIYNIFFSLFQIVITVCDVMLMDIESKESCKRAKFFFFLSLDS